MFGPPTTLPVPELNMELHPGNCIRLGRFARVAWIVCYGWYAWGGNREVCGWYLKDAKDPKSIKPLQRPDLIDIYLVDV